MCTACSPAPASASIASCGNRSVASTSAAAGAIFASASSRTVRRSSWCSSGRTYVIAAPSDVAAVLPADVEERLGDLLQGAHASRLHQDGEHVAARTGRILQRRERLVRLLAVPLLEVADPGQLGLLLLLGTPGQLSKRHLVRGGVRVAVSVDPDDRQGAVVLALLVGHG